MIELQRVHKTYDRASTPAVEDVSLRVEAGEFLILLGESGCGKTTTLKMINRLIEPSSGSIRVDDMDVRWVNPVALRRKIGYVFQEIGLFPHMTVESNVSIVPRLLGWSPDEIRARMDEVLRLVGLAPDEFCSRMPQELSGGQMQRVGLARALAAQPRMMLMDEPFGALDPITRNDLQEQLKALQADLKLTVVMVTHDIHEALLLADRIAVMEKGRIVASGTPRQLVQNAGHPYAEAILAAPRRQARKLRTLLEESGNS